MITNKKGFTLVELIVVITILAILGTIGFISLQGYGRDARDSVRVSDMKHIEKGFELEITTKGKLPIPEDKVDIISSGTVISYQGYAGETVLNQIGIRGGGKDPSDDTYYTYVSNILLTKYQILGFLEGNILGFENNILETINAELNTRTPHISGNELGVLLSTGTLEPIQIAGDSVDIVNTTTEYVTYLSNSESFTGTGADLKKIESIILYGRALSCNDLLKKNKSLQNKNGNYTINPSENLSIDVYCDMTTQGGGWTLVGKWDKNWTNGYIQAMPKGAFQNNINIKDLTFVNKQGSFQSATLALPSFISNGAKYLMHAGLDNGDLKYDNIFFSDIYQVVIENPNNIFNTELDSNSGDNTGSCIDGGGNSIRKNMWYNSNFEPLGYKEGGHTEYNYVLVGGAGDGMFSNKARDGAVYSSTVFDSCNGHSAPYVQWGFYGNDNTLQGYGCSNLKIGTACSPANNNGVKPESRYNLMFIR